MPNLLKTIGYRRLLKGMRMDELYDAYDATEPILEAEQREPRRCVVALAYLVGIRQGVHQERESHKERGGQCGLVDLGKQD